VKILRATGGEDRKKKKRLGREEIKGGQTEGTRSSPPRRESDPSLGGPQSQSCTRSRSAGREGAGLRELRPHYQTALSPNLNLQKTFLTEFFKLVSEGAGGSRKAAGPSSTRSLRSEPTPGKETYYHLSNAERLNSEDQVSPQKDWTSLYERGSTKDLLCHSC